VCFAFAQACGGRGSTDACDEGPLPTLHAFSGNTDSATVVTQRLRAPLKTRFVRLYPTHWHKHMSMRWACY
jgi:hypothetical protein